MNYIYDIYANLNQKYYDIYEWNKKDKIIHIKKIPVFRIKTHDLKILIKDENIVDNELIKLIKNQTEIFNISKNTTFCAFTDTKDEIIVQINKKGKIIQKSSIHFTDNFNNFSSIKRLNLTVLNYSTISKLPINFLSRIDEEKKTILLKRIDELDNKKLLYLYFECFNSKLDDNSLIKQKLKKEIISNNERVYSTIDNFLKLIYAY